MSRSQPTYDRHRFRLAGNDNEIIVDDDERDVEAHRLAANDNEVVVSDDEADVEAHRLAGNDNEVVVDGQARRIVAEDEESDPTLVLRQARR